MTGRRISGALGAAAALAVAGCGSSSPHVPDLRQLPLVPGARIEVQQRVCDSGSSPYCGLELVVTAAGYPNSDRLFDAEHRLLLAKRWSGGDPGSGYDHVADSPGGRLRLTYASPFDELVGTGAGGVRRSHRVQVALSYAMIDHTPALSMLLELGAS